MCVGIPVQVLSVAESGQISRPARLKRTDGVEVQADLALLPEASAGDYVIIHSGYGVSVVTEEQARETAGMLEVITGGGNQRSSRQWNIIDTNKRSKQ